MDEAARLKLPVSVVDREEEATASYNPFTRMKYPLGKGTSETQDAIFEAQEDIIVSWRKKETCIIVGDAAPILFWKR